MISLDTAVDTASQWWSVMTWNDPGVCMYAFGSTGRVQSEDHRAELLAYIDGDCLPDAEPEDVEELLALRKFIEKTKVKT